MDKMLQNPCKTLGFKKNMVYKIPPWGGGGGGKPYPAIDISNQYEIRNAFAIFSLTAAANKTFVPVALAIGKTQAGLCIRLVTPERRREPLLLILRRKAHTKL